MDRTMRHLASAFCVFSGCAVVRPSPPETLTVPAGAAWSGSGFSERSAAIEYAHEVFGSTAHATASALRREAQATRAPQDAFMIMKYPVTHQEYFTYTQATGAPEPWIDEARWNAQQTGLSYSAAQRFMWINGAPEPSRSDHPVVLVDRNDAARFCRWWGRAYGGSGALPTEHQWSRAAAGDAPRTFPWGSRFEQGYANTEESGVGDTTAVGTQVLNRSEFDVYDLAGNVSEWTQTHQDAGLSVVKGGGWTASLVDARTSARRIRPDNTRDVDLGFRCVFSALK